MESRMWTLKAILDCVNNSTPVLFGAPKDPSSSPTHLSDLRAYQWFWWERAGGVYPRFPLIKLPPSWDQSGSCSLRDTTIFAFALCCPHLSWMTREELIPWIYLNQPRPKRRAALTWRQTLNPLLNRVTIHNLSQVSSGYLLSPLPLCSFFVHPPVSRPNTCLSSDPN